MKSGFLDNKQRRAEWERHDVSTSARIGDYATKPTRRELNEMLAEAVRNTAALPVDRKGRAS